MRHMTRAYEIPMFVKNTPYRRQQITALTDLPRLMLLAHTEMLIERPKGTSDDGEFGLVKATVEGDKISLVFWLELPDAE